MEMEFSRTYGPVPTSSKIALVLSFVYSLWFIVVLLRTRRQRASLMPAILPPMLLLSTASWIGYANATQVAVSGRNQYATASQIQEALMLVAFSGIATAILAAIASAAVARMHYEAIGSYPRAPIVIATLCWATSGATLTMPTFIPSDAGFTIWNTSLAAAFVSLALLVPLAVVAGLANRVVVPRRAQLIALTTTLVLALIQTAVAWTLIRHYSAIAMGR